MHGEFVMSPAPALDLSGYRKVTIEPNAEMLAHSEHNKRIQNMYTPLFEYLTARGLYKDTSDELRTVRSKLRFAKGKKAEPYWIAEVARVENMLKGSLDYLWNTQSDLALYLAGITVGDNHVIVMSTDEYRTRLAQAAKFGSWVEYRGTRTQGRFPKRFKMFGGDQ